MVESRPDRLVGRELLADRGTQRRTDGADWLLDARAAVLLLDQLPEDDPAGPAGGEFEQFVRPEWLAVVLHWSLLVRLAVRFLRPLQC